MLSSQLSKSRSEKSLAVLIAYGSEQTIHAKLNVSECDLPLASKI